MPHDRYGLLERHALEQRAGAMPMMRAAPASTLQHAQVQLAAHGFSAGAPDGHPKPQTTNALVAFQAAKKLPVTGTLDSTTVAALAKPPSPGGSMPRAAMGGPIRVVTGSGSASPPTGAGAAFATSPVSASPLPAPVPSASLGIVIGSQAFARDPVTTHLATTGALAGVALPPQLPPAPSSGRSPPPRMSFGPRPLPAPVAGGTIPMGGGGVLAPRAAPPALPRRGGVTHGGAVAALPPSAPTMTAAPMAPTSSAPAAPTPPRMSPPSGGAQGRTFSGARRAAGSPTLLPTGGAPARASSSTSTRRPTMQASYETAGRRVPARFSTTATIASLAQQNLIVTPQIPFRGENFVVDAATAAFFSLREVKVGTWPQNAGGEADLPCTIFSPVQAGAINYEMDLCDAGTQITLTVVNTDSAAHNFVGAIWGHEIKKS